MKKLKESKKTKNNQFKNIILLEEDNNEDKQKVDITVN